jgi:hypothetical protein
MARLRCRPTLAIEQALYRYCRAIDRCDWELLRSCYHPGAIDEHGLYNGDIDGFIEWLQLQLPKYEMTMHILGNVLVEFKGRRVAHVESYCLAYHRSRADVDGQPIDRVVGVRYIDEFTRVSGKWRIKHRRCLYDLGRIDPVQGAERALGPAYRRGAHGPADESYPAMGVSD